MRYRLAALLALLVVGGLGAPVVLAQRPTRVPRIGMLGIDASIAPQRQAAFLEGLSALGYVDSRIIAVEPGANRATTRRG